MIGMTFTRLTVIGEAPAGRDRHRRVLCKCVCGASRIVQWRKLQSGAIKSCGCLRNERVRKLNQSHGHARVGKKTPTYRSWRAMHQRCSGLPSVTERVRFYYQGISVCERWGSFENFLADMGERPLGKTLDRIKGSKNYEPGNCRWATPREQRLNREPRSENN